MEAVAAPPVHGWLTVTAGPDLIRRQESVLILLNLGVLASIGFVHVLFSATLGTPSSLFFVVLMGRFLMQSTELLWLQGKGDASDAAALRIYGSATIWVNIAFAFTLSMLGGMEDAHYLALMVIPVIAAGFRYPTPGLVLVVGVVSAVTFLETWMYTQRHAPVGITEYFEAANIALVYIVVGAVVAVLAAQLRRERNSLAASLAELRRTRDRLVAEEKLAAVGRLSAAIAHEIRNPVAMILSSMTMARGRNADSQRCDELWSIAEEEARRLETLTSDFLAYARQKEPEPRRTSATTTLGYVAGLVEGRAAERDVVIDVGCAAELDGVFDPYQVHQALLNLLINALDAAPRGSRITLGAADTGDGMLELSVENAGEAVVGSVLPRLFEPFFTTKPRGTGLGLAISRTIARAHGGDVVLQSNQDGRVRFALHLPLARPPSSAGEGHGTHPDR